MSQQTFKAVDLFCGAGGESTGMLAAAKAQNMHVDLLAINHWERAIETHSRNHPEARHMCESIQSVDPLQAVPGGRINLLWASPECTHHSVARGGRPCSDQSRASAWLILKWLSELYVDRVIVENVPEFLMWGPISAKGTPIQAARGQTFRAWVKALESLGYTVDWRILRAADYGDPTTRRRLFVQAVRGRKRIMWPLPTHSETPEIFNHSPWVPASSVIDWSLPSESIFERKRPLAAATIGRIEAGISRYWGEMAKPFLVILRGTGTTRDIQRPMPAITAGGCHVGLLQPFVIGQQSGAVPRSVTQPLPTVACAGAISLVQPFICQSEHGERTHSVDCPMPTITCSSRGFGLVQPFLVQYYGNGDARSINQPLDTVTCHDRFALVDGVPATLDIRFRMLQPRELASAQGFPVDYFFAGTKTEQVKQIGNAVPCGLAQALCASGMEAA